MFYLDLSVIESDKDERDYPVSEYPWPYSENEVDEEGLSEFELCDDLMLLESGLCELFADEWFESVFYYYVLLERDLNDYKNDIRVWESVCCAIWLLFSLFYKSSSFSSYLLLLLLLISDLLYSWKSWLD